MEKDKQAPFWTRQTLDWYIRAARRGDYHRRLAALLAPWLSPAGTVCDLGCGAGFLSLALLEHVPTVTALDIDPAALACLEQMGAGKPGLEIRRQDAMKLERGQVWDFLLLSFFGRLTVEGRPEYFLSHCRRRLICVVNGSTDSSFSLTGRSARRREDMTQTADCLRKAGLRFHMEGHTLEFGQPLNDLEEARAFIRRHSPQGAEVADRELLARLHPAPGGGWYLPHRKQIGIFVIEKE